VLFDVGYDKGLGETGVGCVRIGFWRKSRYMKYVY
jgi:hypothetical protein